MDYFGSPSIKSPPPDHAPLPMIPEGHHYQHRQHPQQQITPPHHPDHESLLLQLQRIFAAWSIISSEEERDKERVSGTDGAAMKESNNNKTYLTRTKRFFINLPCNVPVGKWKGMERVSGCSGKAPQGNKTTTYHAGPPSFPIQSFEQQSCISSVWEG